MESGTLFRQLSESGIYVSICKVHFRADEWDVNKWAWEGILKVVSKGEDCIIRLEDKKTGENVLYLWEMENAVLPLLY